MPPLCLLHCSWPLFFATIPRVEMFTNRMTWSRVVGWSLERAILAGDVSLQDSLPGNPGLPVVRGAGVFLKVRDQGHPTSEVPRIWNPGRPGGICLTSLKNTTFLNLLGNMGYMSAKDENFPRAQGVLRGKSLGNGGPLLEKPPWKQKQMPRPILPD